MAITLQDFRDQFSEFDDVPDDKVQRAIDEALTELRESAWKGQYDRGSLYLSAHVLRVRLAMEDEDEELEDLVPLQSKKIGDVSYTFAAALAGFAEAGNLNLTSYGQEYFRIRKLVSVGGFVIA